MGLTLQWEVGNEIFTVRLALQFNSSFQMVQYSLAEKAMGIITFLSFLQYQCYPVIVVFTCMGILQASLAYFPWCQFDKI